MELCRTLHLCPFSTNNHSGIQYNQYTGNCQFPVLGPTGYLLGLCNPLSIEYDLERNSYDLEGTIEGDFMDGCDARLGDQSGSILYGNGFALGANERDIV